MKQIPHWRPTNRRYHHSKFSCLGDLASRAVHHWSINTIIDVFNMSHMFYITAGVSNYNCMGQIS